MFSFPVRRLRHRLVHSPQRPPNARGCYGRRIRLFAASGALVTAVILVMQSGPLPCRRGPVELRSTAAPWPQAPRATPTHHHQVAGDRPHRPRPVRPLSGHPARRHPEHRTCVHPAGARGQPALPLRRRELPDGRRGVHLAHLRRKPAPRRRRTRHRRSPRRAVLGDEADRLEQPLVDHLRGGVQDQLRRDSAVAVLLADLRRRRRRLHADQPAARARAGAVTTGTERSASG